jgi:hypothetical protein
LPSVKWRHIFSYKVKSRSDGNEYKIRKWLVFKFHGLIIYAKTVIILDCSLLVVSLIVQDDIIVFGSTIHLLCTLDDSLVLNNGRSRQWSGGILLTCGKELHDVIISLRVEVLGP